jgi:surface protein
MKQIVNYINEKLHITTKSHLHRYTCHPKTKDELQKIIIERIKEDGPECDLNDIDVSKITDMSNLFDANTEYGGKEIFKDFNGDISLWNVSNVKDMGWLFNCCEKFNCDLSRWDVSNVENIACMFQHCKNFNSDISQWNVSNVNDMRGMFCVCEKFNCNLSQWNVSNVENMYWMFNGCKNFKQNLDMWNVSNVTDMSYMFKDCPTKPKWYKEN